jgi:lipopolysaccharide/colanic/teichoic acid biosynthesis glycosyltransferase
MQRPDHYLPFKRAADVLLALLLIILLSPLLVLAVIGTKLTSRGPLLFRQIRSGRNGREFRISKFRTMIAGRSPDPKELVPLDHPEITPFGRFLRRTKIDELPQLFCVLAGHMSIVGPRPTLPDQVARYDDFQRQRLHLRPGINGLAQVNGSTALSWPERIKYDVYYVHHCSLGLDLTILLKTLHVILRGEKRFARPFEQSPYARRT